MAPAADLIKLFQILQRTARQENRFLPEMFDVVRQVASPPSSPCHGIVGPICVEQSLQMSNSMLPEPSPVSCHVG